LSIPFSGFSMTDNMGPAIPQNPKLKQLVLGCGHYAMNVVSCGDNLKGYRGC